MANTFIVPHDFTSVGDTALKQALFLANRLKSKIILLHIISNDNKKQEALNQLKATISAIPAELKGERVEIEPEVLKGSIFDDIGKFAEEKEARLIIMGTHGLRGMQKVFGSHAIKVIKSTSVPFMVVQDGYEPKQLKKIVVPIDISQESLQIIKPVGDWAQLFDAQVDIIAEKHTDSRLLRQTKIRIAVTKKDYEEKDIKCNFHLLKGKKSVQQQIIDHANENNADLIAIAYYSTSLLPQFDGFAQSFLLNEAKIPCLIINAKLFTKFYF